MSDRFANWQSHASTLGDVILSVLASPNATMPEEADSAPDQIRATIRFGALLKVLKETLATFSEPTDSLLKELVPIGSKITVDEYTVNHHSTAGKVDGEMWKLAVETDDTIRAIEARWEAACEARNKERAGYAEAGSSLRWTMPK